MASNVTADDLKSLCECPVCVEPFKSPRLLKCGHQFCEKCLTGIIEKQVKKEIPCPTCRQVTVPDKGEVTNLPRSTLHQYMQELIYLLPRDDELGKTCTKCGENEPVRHCPDCKPSLSFMCEGCFNKHQKVPRLADHKNR